MYLYGNIQTPKNTAIGLSQELLLAPLSTFETVAEPNPDGVLFEKESIVSDNHIFKTGSEGFIRVRLAPHRTQVKSATAGSNGSRKLESTLNASILGSYAELHGYMSILQNEPVIALVKDASCGAGKYYQMGTRKRPALLKSNWQSGSTKDGIKAYDVELSSVAACVMIYEGYIAAYGKRFSRWTKEFDNNFF